MRPARLFSLLVLATFALMSLFVPRPLLAQEAIHIVQSGETLEQIAQQFGSNADALRRLNNLEEADDIYTGLPLLVPGAGSGSAVFSQSRTPSASAAPNHSPRGQNLSGMAILRDASSAERGAPGRMDADRTFVLRGGVGGAGGVEPPQDVAKRIASGPVRWGKWIDVDLSEQRVTAVEDMTPVRTFVVSTGVSDTPTVTGEFRIWAKTTVQDMSGGNLAAGDYYYLEDVPWVQYFYAEYAFHGTYWHTNFGHPMSHGCINMRNADAKWLFDWTAPTHPGAGAWLYTPAGTLGTLVVVHE